MRVRVRILVTPLQVMRYQTVEVELPEGGCVGEALHRLPLGAVELESLFQTGTPQLKLRLGLAVLINGENAAFRDVLRTPLSEGDRVSLLQTIRGG